MKKTTLFTLLSLFSVFFAQAQYRITGRISDGATQTALANIAVHLSDFKKTVTTDATGRYTLENLKKGTYLLEITGIGYKTQVKRYTVSRDTMIDFVLQNAVSELSEVVVTGVSRSTELRKTPLVIKTLDQSFLTQSTASNLIDALKNVPGISQISSGVAVGKPVVRGLGYNRVITLNNGVRQEGQQWGDEHGIEIDEYAIERIEIIKGPGSLMYGSDGIAGVLNFLAPKAPPVGEVKTHLLTNFQSNNRCNA